MLEFQPKRPWATPLGVLCPSSQRADHSFHVEASEARLERKHKRFRSKVSQSNYSAASFCKHKGAARGSKFSSHKLFTTINKNKIILRIIHFKRGDVRRGGDGLRPAAGRSGRGGAAAAAASSAAAVAGSSPPRGGPARPQLHLLPPSALAISSHRDGLQGAAFPRRRGDQEGLRLGGGGARRERIPWWGSAGGGAAHHTS